MDQMHRRGAKRGLNSMTAHRWTLESEERVCFGRTIDRPAAASFFEQVLGQKPNGSRNQDCGREAVLHFTLD